MSKELLRRKNISLKRRILLSQQFKITDPNLLDATILNKNELDERRYFKRLWFENSRSKTNKIFDRKLYNSSKTINSNYQSADKEEIYTDSSAFLKGTQSANPHNDYCQHFVDTGERPQNFIRDVGLTNRFEEYPKLRELILLKDELITQTNTPPMYMKCDLANFDLRDLDSQFDVILIEPPLEEYQRTIGVTYDDKYWSWDEIEKLEIEHVAANRSFIWIWCGSSDGLDAGRRCLRKWGYRRCEDICWIKTNIKNPGHNKNLEPNAIFQRTKEHCLMGIKGTVRRSTDGEFIHANVDIDLVIAEEFAQGSDEKPIEIFHIIEHFCLGRRRLHLFGQDASTRPGWLTIGPRLTASNYDPETYMTFFNQQPNGHLTGCTEDIERMRPKSPPPKNSQLNLNNNLRNAATPSQPVMTLSTGNLRNIGSNMVLPIQARLAPPPRPNSIMMAPSPMSLWPSGSSSSLGQYSRPTNNRQYWIPRPGLNIQR